MANFKGDAQAVTAIDSSLAGAQHEPVDSMSNSESQHALRMRDAGVHASDGQMVREKFPSFDVGRMPEPRANTGAVARGIFTLYESQCELTKAAFLQKPNAITPVAVQFSILSSVRSANDCARDPRGFSVRFFTGEGNFDLLGSNFPVLDRQHSTKFADTIHAANAEPDNQTLQVSSAGNRFWELASLNPESTHATLWAMSDRALPRSFAMMEGFGVHSFRFVNVRGEVSWVKFHWKPLLGVHSLVWDEVVKLAAKDADFHRRHLWELIDRGHYPEWELGVQIVPDAERYKFDFDLQDTTKIIPESLVPVQVIGKLCLNQNPENYFSEIDRMDFHTENLVPGIDFGDEHLTKVFSGSDVQMSRLCSAHFNELPVSRSRVALDKLKHDIQLYALKNIDHSAVNETNSFGVEESQQQYAVANDPIRFLENIRSERRAAINQQHDDHYSQAALFWRSQSPWEQDHIVAAFCFELAKVSEFGIRERMVSNLVQVDVSLAQRVAKELGVSLPASLADSVSLQGANVQNTESSLSLMRTQHSSVVGRCVAILVANGFESERFLALRDALIAGGAAVKIIASRLGEVKCNQGLPLQVDHSLATVGSVMFDAVYIPGGPRSVEALCKDANAILFVKETYKHGKCVAASNEGGMLITRAARSSVMSDVFKGPGVVTSGPSTPTGDFVDAFITAVATHRFNERPDMNAIVA